MMKPPIFLLGLLIAAVSPVISESDESKPKSKYIFIELIDVKGMCWEDHVGKRDSYGGHIVRWQEAKFGRGFTYGSVSIPFDPQRSIDEATHPTTFHSPFMIEFADIRVDTSQPKWTLSAVSSHTDGGPQYDSTCEVEVLKRGTERPPGAELMKNPIDWP
jgi:hypothetical protein